MEHQRAEAYVGPAVPFDETAAGPVRADQVLEETSCPNLYVDNVCSTSEADDEEEELPDDYWCSEEFAYD